MSLGGINLWEAVSERASERASVSVGRILKAWLCLEGLAVDKIELKIQESKDVGVKLLLKKSLSGTLFKLFNCQMFFTF